MRWPLLPFVLQIVLCLIVACGSGEERNAPVRALMSFLTAIERSTHEPVYREQAYAWIDEASQQELARRASLARSLAGREMPPWEMLVPGRLTVTTRELRRRAPRVEIEGDQASVRIEDADPIPLVREEDGWRVRLFPEVQDQDSE